MNTLGDEPFQQLLGDDVTPIQQETRMALTKTVSDKITLKHRRTVAESETVATQDPLTTEPMHRVDPLAELSFRRPGIQWGVFRNLKQGHYTLEARLDLHKRTVEQARVEVYQFIKDCVTQDVRTALITHGKGELRDQPALLKSCVAYWLPQMDEVLAFHSAQKQHGGLGATYVLLRKSERKKQATRDAFLNR